MEEPSQDVGPVSPHIHSGLFIARWRARSCPPYDRLAPPALPELVSPIHG